MMKLRAHKCMAEGCPQVVQAFYFMCAPHWDMLAKSFQDEIWKHYRPGQEHDLNLSEEYTIAAFKAIAEVARLEGREEQSAWFKLMAHWRELPP